ncbi:MAG: hypothetical protein ABW224_22900 [Kibdelosporangium sp.]
MNAAVRLDLLRDLTCARTRYEERFGWPVSIEVDPGRLVMALGEAADAIVMPRQLGTLVLADLRIALLAGPVLADTTGQWWMFLTRPADRSAPKHRTELRCLEVHLAPTGSRVVIPREFDRKIGCPWIEQPRPLAQLPPWPSVLATTRRLGAARAVIPAQRSAGLLPIR